MNTIETRISRLFRDIPESARKNEMMREIIQDLGDKVGDLVSQGLTEEEAVQKAIDDFGDIDDIRRELVGSAQLEISRSLGLSLAFSVWGGVLITALFVFINLYYTPRHIWFVYPVFAVIWWPMSLFFHWLSKRRGRGMAFPYSVASYVLIMGLMLFINYYYTPHIVWYVYPAFAVIWWPVATCFCWLRRKNREEDKDE